jgi:hypothetical protein
MLTSCTQVYLLSMKSRTVKHALVSVVLALLFLSSSSPPLASAPSMKADAAASCLSLARYMLIHWAARTRLALWAASLPCMQWTAFGLFKTSVLMTNPWVFSLSFTGLETVLFYAITKLPKTQAFARWLRESPEQGFLSLLNLFNPTGPYRLLSTARTRFRSKTEAPIPGNQVTPSTPLDDKDDPLANNQPTVYENYNYRISKSSSDGSLSLISYPHYHYSPIYSAKPPLTISVIPSHTVTSDRTTETLHGFSKNHRTCFRTIGKLWFNSTTQQMFTQLDSSSSGDMAIMDATPSLLGEISLDKLIARYLYKPPESAVYYEYYSLNNHSSALFKDHLPLKLVQDIKLPLWPRWIQEPTNNYSIKTHESVSCTFDPTENNFYCPLSIWIKINTLKLRWLVALGHQSLSLHLVGNQKALVEFKLPEICVNKQPLNTFRPVCITAKAVHLETADEAYRVALTSQSVKVIKSKQPLREVLATFTLP